MGRSDFFCWLLSSRLLFPEACGEPSAWPYVLVLLEEMKGRGNWGWENLQTAGEPPRCETQEVAPFPWGKSGGLHMLQMYNLCM